MVIQQKRAVLALAAIGVALLLFQLALPLLVGVLGFGLGSLALPFGIFLAAGLLPLVLPLGTPSGEATRDEMLDAIAERSTRLAGIAATVVAALYCAAKFTEYAVWDRSHISIGHLMLIAMTTVCTFIAVRAATTLVLHARMGGDAGDPR
jgi:fumarate reductase subunit D